VNAVAKSRAAYRGAPLALKALAWGIGAVVFAVIGLSLEPDAVKQSNARLRAYERSHHIESAQQGGRGGGGGGGAAPETSGAAPTKVEGADKQLAAGATPTEISATKIPKGLKADDAGVRKLFAATLGSRGRTGQHQNRFVSAKCGSGHCDITYVPDGPGVGRVIETQGPLWAGLASDKGWRSAKIVALPVKKGSNRHAVGHKTSITCDRAGLARVGKWGIESTPKIRRFCRIAPSPGA
jgi:hypothetical protein